MAHYVPIPKDLNDIKEKFIMGFTETTGNMLRYRSCSWCACVFSHTSVYRNVGSYIRNGCGRRTCDPLRHLQEKRRVLGETGEVHA